MIVRVCCFSISLGLGIIRAAHLHQTSFTVHGSAKKEKEKSNSPTDPSNKNFIKLCIYTIPLVILTYVVKIINKWNCDHSHYFLQGHNMNKYCFS